MAPFKPHDAAVPLGSGMEVDVGPDHGPLSIRGLTTGSNQYYGPVQIEPRPTGKNRGVTPPRPPR